MFAFRFHARLISTQWLTGVAVCLLLLAAGCEKKQAKVVPPVLVPSIETQPQPEPTEQPAPANADTAPKPVTVEAPPQNPQKPKPRPRKPVTKKPPQQPASAEAPKQEVPKTSAVDSSVQITADVPRAAVQSQRQNTENLLRNSEGKLSHITRNLGDSELGMLRQARNYIAQSNQALQGGDIERAYNLAVKASLLANELAK